MSVSKKAAPLIEVSILHLAVLRAAVEGVPASTYFGSLGALANWIEETRLKSLIVSTAEPTELGRRVAEFAGLRDLGPGRAYLWEGREAALAKAQEIINRERGQQR
jgi:hypothetical protein